MPPRRKVKARTPELAALGEAIRQTREEAHLTLEQLADRLDTEFKWIGKLERGQGNPSYTTLLRVANGLETQIGVLTTLADQIQSEQDPN